MRNISKFIKKYKGVFLVLDYNALLIDLLNEKIRRLEQGKDEQRKLINRLQKEIKALKKEVVAEVKSDEE